MTTERIGFVGVGLMGRGMAANILKSGYPLSVIAHRNREPVAALVAAGAQEAAGLPELAAASDVVFICAPGSPEVEAIVRDLAPHLARGSVIVDCSTADPTSTVTLAAELAAGGIALADAPLGGTPAQAEEGKLSAMVGADDAVFARIRPIIDTWAATVVHLGAVGLGHKMKLLNNFLSLGYGAIYAEALAVARNSGVTAEQFDSVIRGSRMDCGFYQTFMGHVIDGNRESHKFTLNNALKDATYLELMAQASGTANPIGNAIKNSYLQAVNGGADGPEDYVPHMTDHVARMNGISGKYS